MTDAKRLERLVDNIEVVFRGKTETVRLAVVALLARGHVLLEDVPGVGKTTLARAIARSLDCSFKRIQFTSDMLPSDVIGTTVLDSERGTFTFRRGPVFANILLADEINRTPPRTQSALLEAMNERQVTVDNDTHALAEPFLVMATQNPLEHHGTYPLPESQMDRFLVRLQIGYPEPSFEQEIIRSQASGDGVEGLAPVLDRDELLALQRRVGDVAVDQALLDYLTRIVELTRSSSALSLGVSTRGAISLYRAAQARALLNDRSYAVADDIKSLVVPVLGHRVWVQTSGSGAGGDRERAAHVLAELLESVPVPL